VCSLRRLLALSVLALTIFLLVSTLVLQGSIYIEPRQYETRQYVTSESNRRLVFNINNELELIVEAPLEVMLGARALISISLHATRKDIVVQTLNVLLYYEGAGIPGIPYTSYYYTTPIEVRANSTWTDAIALYGWARGPVIMRIDLVYDSSKTFRAEFVVTVIKAFTYEQLLEQYIQALRDNIQALRDNIELRRTVAYLKDELEYCRREQYRLRELLVNMTAECGRLVSDVERRCEERTSSLEVEKARLMGELDRCELAYRDLFNYYNELLKVFEGLRADSGRAWMRVAELEGVLNTSLAGNVALSIALALLAVFAFKRRAH
jgi:hypothetical protein